MNTFVRDVKGSLVNLTHIGSIVVEENGASGESEIRAYRAWYDEETIWWVLSEGKGRNVRADFAELVRRLSI